MFGLFKSKDPKPEPTGIERRIVKDIPAGAEARERHVIPVMAEELDITKRRVTGDTLRVNLHTETELQTATVELMRDAVDVRRVAIDEPVASIPTTRTEGATTIIPVVRERLVLKKELVLVEEIHITHERDSQTVSRDVELRRQVPEITRLSAGSSEPA